MTIEMFWITALSMLSLGLAVVCMVQQRRIENLKLRLRQSYPPNQPLTYLREQLAYKPKIEAIKALREQYPELSLEEAVQLWQQK